MIFVIVAAFRALVAAHLGSFVFHTTASAAAPFSASRFVFAFADDLRFRLLSRRERNARRLTACVLAFRNSSQLSRFFRSDRRHIFALLNFVLTFADGCVV